MHFSWTTVFQEVLALASSVFKQKSIKKKSSNALKCTFRSFPLCLHNEVCKSQVCEQCVHLSSKRSYFIWYGPEPTGTACDNKLEDWLWRMTVVGVSVFSTDAQVSFWIHKQWRCQLSQWSNAALVHQWHEAGSWSWAGVSGSGPGTFLDRLTLLPPYWVAQLCLPQDLRYPFHHCHCAFLLCDTVLMDSLILRRGVWSLPLPPPREQLAKWHAWDWMMDLLT